MTGRRIAVLACALLVVLAGCGGADDRGSRSAEDFDPTSATKVETVEEDTEPVPAQGRGSQPASPPGEQDGVADPGGPDAADEEAAAARSMRLDLTLSATCAMPGGTMTAHVRTEPDVMIGYTAYYSNHSYVPDIHFVPSHTNTTGSHSWTWTLRPDTPLGEAAVEVVAGARGRGAAEKAPFEVARSC